MKRITPGIVLGILTALVTTSAAGDSKIGPRTFDGVRAIFQSRCLRCHGADEPEAGLDLRSAQSTLVGSELGPVVEPGSLEESLLWSLIEEGEMPPTGPPLSPDQQETIRHWILSGAQTEDLGGSSDHFEAIKPRPTNADALQRLINQQQPEVTSRLVSDETFLRRVTFDLIGRQPTSEERSAFLSSREPNKRAAAIDRLLENPEFGQTWARYWSDTISYRVPPPELTYLSYDEFEGWLADRLNRNIPWSVIVREILTATGKVADDPSTTFVAFHQADPVKLSSETSRIFLGLQIQCAECHDHKFDHWKRTQFHNLAAFFGRTEAKLAQKKPGPTVVKAKGKGEYRMPNIEEPSKKGQLMPPSFLDDRGLETGASDAQRRAFLALAVTEPTSPWFSRSYVNRIWGKLNGRGFFEPVDNMAAYVQHDWPEVHDTLAAHFAYTRFDIKGMFRLMMNTPFYQRELPHEVEASRVELGFGEAVPRRLSGDEVFNALVNALELPNVRPAEVKPTEAIRFPPPPKSTRDLVADRFGFDPSLCPDEVARSIGQAMMLMNNAQIQARIESKDDTPTLVTQLLSDDRLTDRDRISLLFDHVLGRSPTDSEFKIAFDHLNSLPEKREALEDLLWSLINSAEFSSRR